MLYRIMKQISIYEYSIYYVSLTNRTTITIYFIYNIEYNMKQKISLIESKLRDIISESVKTAINEIQDVNDIQRTIEAFLDKKSYNKVENAYMDHGFDLLYNEFKNFSSYNRLTLVDREEFREVLNDYVNGQIEM